MTTATVTSSKFVRTRTLPMIYGYLGNGWTKELGRGCLMKSLSATMPVILLDPGSPTGHHDPYLDEVGTNRYVIRNAFRLRYSRVGKRIARLAAAFDGRKFSRVLRSGGFDDFVFWLTVNDPRMLLSLPEHHLVYDCMDPCFFPDKQAQFDRDERSIAVRADIIFCSAHTLHQRMQAWNPKSYLLPNACARETYDACHSERTQLPPTLIGRKRPIIGYMGTIDWRFDAATVTAVAKMLPDCTFVIVGRVNQDQEKNIAEMRQLPNVIVTGSASFEEGHAYTRAFDVALIPFIPGPMNDAINSVKMYMYLVAGKPIVSTWLNECVLAQPRVSPTRTSKEFAEAIRTALTTDSEPARQERIAFGLKNTWDDRAEQAIAQMKTEGILPS